MFSQKSTSLFVFLCCASPLPPILRTSLAGMALKSSYFCLWLWKWYLMFTSTKLDWICTKSPNQYDGICNISRYLIFCFLYFLNMLLKSILNLIKPTILCQFDSMQTRFPVPKKEDDGHDYLAYGKMCLSCKIKI